MCGFGIEEEFLLVDRQSLLPARESKRLQEVQDEMCSSTGASCTEWLPCQIEHATAVLTSAAEAFDSLLAFRRTLSAAAQARGMLAVGLGTAPQISEAAPAVTDGLRYREFAALAPGIASEQYINGMHVHVGIPDRQSGISAVNGMRRWLPVLTALSANSPLWRGVDSGFASWRSIHYRRWVVYGVPPHFRDLDDYEAQVDALVRSDVVFDEASLGWLVRLSHHHDTVEIRTCDVQSDPETALILAVLIRALVHVEMEDPPAQAIASNLLDVAHWQSARFGLSGGLMDPAAQTSVPAAEGVRRMFERALPGLERTRDAQRVRRGLRRLLSGGTGAARQRRSMAERGMGGVFCDAEQRLTCSSSSVPECRVGALLGVPDPP